ncbi:TPA: hypothetical protein OUE92_001746 [Serratia marcescens]|nr:hypothetical protein [Serratia marcescens]
MAITAITVSKCFSYINDVQRRKLKINITSDSPADLKKKKVSVYYDKTSLLIAESQYDEAIPSEFELPIDINLDEFISIVRHMGFSSYRLRVEENFSDGTVGVIFFSDIQFMDIYPEITNVLVSKTKDGVAEFVVTVKYYSPGVLIDIKNEKYNKTFTFKEYQYDADKEVWVSSMSILIDFGECHEKLKFTAVGNYKGDMLPCNSDWSTCVDVNGYIEGVCMITNWQRGTNVFWDSPANDSIRDLQRTKKSGHLLVTYYAQVTTTRTNSLMTRLETAQGALHPPMTIHSLQASDNKDVSTTSIDGTDDFVAVWAGNFSGHYQIYVRKFTANQNSIGSPQIQEIAISGNDGDYVCPRIIYNPASNLLLATWVSVIEKKIQGVYLDPNTLEKMSYDFDISLNIYSGYINRQIDLGVTKVENIVLMNHGDQVIVSYLERLGELRFMSIGKPVGGTPPVHSSTQYSQAGMGKFHAVLDAKSNNIMLVYVLGMDIYGTKLKMFAADEAEVYDAIKINSISSGQPSFPYINQVSNSQNKSEFHVAWSSATMGAFFNRFDDNFFAIDAETRVNETGLNTMFPKLAASDNQIAMLFQANRLNAIPLSGTGIISYITDHASNP